MSSKRPQRPEVSKVDAMRLAAAAGCDPRTAARALAEGPEAIRNEFVRTRIARAMGGEMGEFGAAARGGVRIGD